MTKLSLGDEVLWIEVERKGSMSTDSLTFRKGWGKIIALHEGLATIERPKLIGTYTVVISADRLFPNDYDRLIDKSWQHILAPTREFVEGKEKTRVKTVDEIVNGRLDAPK